MPREVSTDFPNNFAFYRLEENLLMPTMDKVIVSYIFNDGLEKFEATGLPLDLLDEYKSSGLYRYLRNNYDNSDNMATFRVVETDNLTFVKYKIDVGELKVVETPPETDKNAPTTPPTDKGGANYTPEQLIAIEQEKQKTLELEIKKIDKILDLLAKGYTKAEVNKLLGL
jgi:hypothetical protein